MRPRICICCGEEIRQTGNALSRNPNVCASCSSLVDGMEEPCLPVKPLADAAQPLAASPEPDPLIILPRLRA